MAILWREDLEVGGTSSAPRPGAPGSRGPASPSATASSIESALDDVEAAELLLGLGERTVVHATLADDLALARRAQPGSPNTCLPASRSRRLNAPCRSNDRQPILAGQGLLGRLVAMEQEQEAHRRALAGWMDTRSTDERAAFRQFRERRAVAWVHTGRQDARRDPDARGAGARTCRSVRHPGDDAPRLGRCAAFRPSTCRVLDQRQGRRRRVSRSTGTSGGRDYQQPLPVIEPAPPDEALALGGVGDLSTVAR